MPHLRRVVSRNGQDGRVRRLIVQSLASLRETVLPARCGLPFLIHLTALSMNELDESPAGDTLTLLLHSHRRFLAFLQRRTGSRETAEEILQSAFVKAVEHVDSLRRDTAIAWFYRILRNSLVDFYRKQDAEQRALDVRRASTVVVPEPFHELSTTICECFRALLPTLKDEYRDILRLVDLGDFPVADAAAQLNISANNASVRLHRARLALKKRLEQTCRTCAAHGCFDCSCKSS